jgi:pimeloyl-ACP methyl ester carboxylesterase
MKRRDFILTGLLGLAGGPARLWADDLGRFLDKAAKEALDRQFSQENLDRLFAPFEMEADIVPAKTPDNWTLVAHHFRPRVGPLPGSNPVILCHGLSYSALFWDLDPACSFAEYLARRGHDVWAVSLRGCGLSQKWVWKVESAPTLLAGSALRKATKNRIAITGYASADPKYANWDMDDHIAYDVPTLVNLVRQQTGAKEVTWVGHSMGGIVALAHLARYPNPGIARLVTVGSQVTMPEGQLVLEFLYESLKTRELQLGGKLTGRQLAAESRVSAQNMFFNEGNTSRKVYTALTTYANDVPSVGLLKQYTLLAKKGELHDAKGNVNYAKLMGKVTVPVLLGCGEADQLAPPAVQQYLFENVGSKDKTLLVIGRSAGFPVNAGHNDALVGLTSQQFVFPVLERWLRTGRA